MDLHNLLQIRTRQEFREWLAHNHASERECWISVKRGRPKEDGTFWYIDAVEEALCFGWIDGTTKRLTDGITVQRFSPRRARSQWSELNKARCRRMERLGMMTEAGRAVLPDLSENGFSIDDDILQTLQSDRLVWENFMKLPPLYRRVRIDTIQIKCRDERLFRQRLGKFVENTAKGVVYGEWNDNGRLNDDE